jgi:uncharacterized membrane protein YqjE
MPEQAWEESRGPDPEQPSAGLLQSLRNLATTLVALLQTRLELLATDLEEGSVRMLQILFLAAGAFLFITLGMLTLTLLAVLLLWEDRQIAAVVGVAVAFFAVAVGLAFGVRNRIRARPRFLGGTVGELAKDRERLTSR